MSDSSAPDGLGEPSAKGAELAVVPERVEAIPDLLHTEPLMGIDADGLCSALDFAFAGGSCGEVLANVLDQAPMAPSDFRPECFSVDLFVEQLVERCMAVQIQGWQAPLNTAWLTRVLSHPPADGAVVDFRRQILAELGADKGARRSFEELYRQLCRFRSCFGRVGPQGRYETTRRRLETLAALRDAVERLAAGFCSCTSGLGRIAAFGREIQSSEGYQRLGEVLDYENDLAKVDLRMQLGVDGRVRRFQIVRMSENERNRFYLSPLGRLLAKVVLWWRGYRFSEDELVDRWLDDVFAGMSRFLPALFQLLGHMELYLAALGFRDRCRSKGLEVCFAELTEEGGRSLRGLYNPLLFVQDVVPIPCDIEGESFDATTIITGPNSGGKTRLLQALGLAQMLAQGGLYVPAKSARLRRASGLFVSLVQEVRVDQKEGHLGTELLRIRQLFETSRPGSVVLFDELCSGTNPSEAEQIIHMVLALLRELRPEVYITTHFLRFAEGLIDDAAELGLSFLQVELDEHQRPTFGFVPGVASSSLAAQTAARLGVTRADLMALVRRNRR